MQAEWMLAKRELIRFFRQKNRVFGAIGQPLIFWLLFGAGFKSAFQYDTGFGSISFQEYFFPGTVALILLFTAIFSSFSTIEDRNEGFLQSVLVAPVPRHGIVLGKVLGASLLALFQGLLFSALGPLLGLEYTLVSALLLVGVVFLIAFSLSALGFCFAWKMTSTAGFHAIMSILLLPMWLLSGAFFPLEGASGWLSALMRMNPLTYGVAALRHVFYLPSAQAAGAGLSEGLPGFALSLGILAGFTLLVFGAALILVRARETGSQPV